MLNENLIKAVNCIASNDPEGNCYMDYFNLTNHDKHMYCGSPLFDRDNIQCPYYQKEYDTCFVDGGCAPWLKELADMLEKNKDIIKT